MGNLEIFFFFVLGAMLGSFSNVIIYRMPKDLSIVSPRSHCYACKKTIAWYDNIPVLSWFILRGKCRNCQAPYSFRYAFVEFFMGLMFAAIFYYQGWNWLLLEYLIFAFALITASVIDLDHMILPDEFTLSGIVIGLVGSLLNPEREFLPALFGMLIGGGFLWAIAALYVAIRKQEGMGGGDIKLLAWIGAVLGWKSIPFVILSSSVIGSLVGIFFMFRTKAGLNTAIPYGPFLAGGALLYIFGGHWLADMYVSLFIPPQ